MHIGLANSVRLATRPREVDVLNLDDYLTSTHYYQVQDSKSVICIVNIRGPEEEKVTLHHCMFLILLLAEPLTETLVHARLES